MAKKRRIKKQYEFGAIRNPSKYLFDFSNWESLSGEDFRKLKFSAFQFYYKEVKYADLINEIYVWMKNNEYSKEDIRQVKKSPPLYNVGVLCRLLRSGCPDINPTEVEYVENLKAVNPEKPLSHYITTAVDSAIIRGKNIADTEEEKESRPSAEIISIQDRMRQQIEPLLSDLESSIDDFLNGVNMSKWDPYKMMVSFEPEVKPAHAKIIQDTFENDHALAHEIVEWKDEEIKEGYSFLNTVAKRKAFLSIYDSIRHAAQMIIDAGKSKRKSRKPKAVSKEKLVAKLKFKNQDTEYKITSINPIDIIGVGELWTFNTKTRDLTQFIADPLLKELSVKGTTIVGFDEGKSTKKKLRKPDEQLKEFNESGKVAIRKFMDTLTTKASLVNGRINNDTILLRVL